MVSRSSRRNGRGFVFKMMDLIEKDELSIKHDDFSGAYACAERDR